MEISLIVQAQNTDLSTNKLVLTTLLEQVEADDSSYRSDGSYTSEAYTQKVALERAIEGINMALANLAEIAK